MQALNAGYELNSDARGQLEALIAEHNREVSRARSQYGVVSNPSITVRNADRTISDGTRFDQPPYQSVRGLFFQDGQFLPHVESVRLLREALVKPGAQRLLTTELELRAGTVKLVANGVWGTSWGAPITWERVDPLLNDRVYLGVPGEVFPRGIAEFDGLNIPVEPGRYRLRFNTHTFEYAFDRIEDRG